MECRHCQREGGNNRGLCYRCWCDQSIRIRYPVLPIVRNPADMVGRPTKGRLLGLVDPNPTNALPGTEAKVRVLVARAAAGYQLFHPEDATFEPDLELHLPLHMLAREAS